MKAGFSTALGCLALVFAVGTVISRSSELQAERAISVPAPAWQAETPASTQTAVFAGGCFWGVQGVFQHVKGVKSAVSGYAGGDRGSADYETVSSGRTRHAEAVQIVYDPKVVSYGTLLQVFFSVVADPTTLNYQGPDHGTQYRSAIFPATPEQKATAERYISQLSQAKVWPRPIVTRIEKGGFYPAEGYHQNFLVRKPDHPYIRAHDLPKVAALKHMFPERYRAQAVLVPVRR